MVQLWESNTVRELISCSSLQSWQRGLNENTNELLRKYFPKNINLKAVSQQKVNTTVGQINSGPRKFLVKNARTADEQLQGLNCGLDIAALEI
jgi:IS30 family transposase